jgi:molybdate transport system ATP-binding protein
MHLISIEDGTIRAGSRTFFNHIDWTIENGEHWAILGPTGAGKSLLARAISRKVSLLNGQIRFFFDPAHEPDGRTFLHPDEVLTLSAETHQDFLGQYSEYYQARWQSFEGEDAPTVLDLLKTKHIHPFSVQEDVPVDERQLQDVIGMLKLDHLLERKVLSLSHGESRKVFIARLLLRSPRLLILDDPYTGLDQASRERLAQAIDEMIRRGNPQILLVGSREEEIPDGITHMILVRDGQVVCKGDRKTVGLELESMRSVLAQAPTSINIQTSAAFARLVDQYKWALEKKATRDGADFIEMRQVSVTYGTVEVLKNVSWTVSQGERWALLGENGAGKTTLLSLVLADNPQSYSNSIFLFGRERGTGESIWEIKQRIGWVSPELHIYYPKTATCLEVICSGFFDSVGLYRRASPEQTAVALEWLSAFGMELQCNQPFHSLSTGQQRLVLLGRAIVKNPPLLILDEPCQGLDDGYRRTVVDLVNQICLHTPITLVYVTHYQDELPPAITHRLRLTRGEIVENGPCLSGHF